MKKTLYLLLVVCVPFITSAQNYSNAEKALISARVDSLVQKYMESSRLTDVSVNKKKDSKEYAKVFNRVMKDFKSLFALNATIFDDINPVFNEKARGTIAAYELEEKSRLDFFDGLAEEFPSGLVINNKRVNISYDKFNEGIITVALARNITGETYTYQYSLVNDDTLKMTIAIQPDKSVKISSISKIGSNLRVINDMDYDGVIDKLDDCKDKTGKISLKGCPDRDDDGIPDRKDDCPDIKGSFQNNGCPITTSSTRFVFSGSLGYMLNANTLKTPEDGFGYGLNGDASDMDKNGDNGGSINGKIKNPGLKGGIALNASIAYYFGKKKNNKNKGISIGISTTGFRATYSFSTPVRYVYHAKDAAGDDYRRIVTMQDGAYETITYSVFNFPLLFKYKARFNSKIAGEIGAGPSYISLIPVSSVSNAAFKYEGIYQYENGEFKYYSNFDPSNGYVDFTDDGVSNHIFIDQNNNTETLYGLLDNAGYDFLLPNNNPDEKKSNIDRRSGFAFNASADLMYHISAKSAIKLGFNFIIAPAINHKNDKYIMVDSSEDTYNSIYNSNAKSTFTSFGLNVGIVLGFGK